jgi:hypothetical protein
MLDRAVVREFLKENFEEREIKVPKGIKMNELTEAFCLFVEDDYYEWLNDNYKSFFSGLNWDRIKEKIKKYKETHKQNFD